MQSYGIIVAFLREGDSILTWKLQFPALGTIVSYLGNSRVLPWKLQFVWLQVADVFIFFQLYRGGLHITK